MVLYPHEDNLNHVILKFSEIITYRFSEVQSGNHYFI